MNLEDVIYLFLFLAVLGLHCCAGFSAVVVSRGLLFSSGAGASHCGRSSYCGARALGTQWLRRVHSAVLVAPRLESTGLVIVALSLSYPVACGIFLDQVSNTCPLHWQVNSLPGKFFSHQESP